jgi:uncharacterized protein (TIGR02996 family)
MTDEDAFQLALDADPSNHATRLVFADWLEEQGDWRAEGYRWMGANEKWPCPPERSKSNGWYSENRWHFWDQPFYKTEDYILCHCDGIAKGKWEQWEFDTRRECEEAICRAVALVTV